MQQHLPRLTNRLNSRNLPPQPSQLHQPLTSIERQRRIDLFPQPLRQRRTLASR